MRAPHAEGWTRRRFLGGLTVAGAAGLLGLHPRPIAAEPPPETTTITLVRVPSLCQTPLSVAEALLRDEGFTTVEYLKTEGATEVYQRLASGQGHLSMAFAAPFIMQVDAGAPIVMLAGVHPGCYELFGTERVHAIRDLKGKTVAVLGLGGGQHVFLASMAAYVGLNPRTDIHWVTYPPVEAMRRLAEGTIDAYLGFPPDPQELRAKQIGHVVVNSAVDRPWSQYFCCLVTGNRAFVRQHPVATKRALRAILKAGEVCTREPERAAQFMVDKGYAPRYDYTLQTITALPYLRWREYDPEDTVRFYALRLHEAGMIKRTPQQIIAQGTDWGAS
jgi:NitT/TauT family transport system substrate-binding protein